MKTIGEKILKLRTQKRLSQEELSLEIGVARQTISKWELGTMQPNLENIKSLCAVFGVSIDYFLKGEPEMEVTAEIDEEHPVSELISAETVAQTKRKPWKPLIVAVVFSVLTFVPLFFSIATGVIAFSSNRGDDVVAEYNFDGGAFFVSLCFTILCFSVAVVGWIRYILIKKDGFHLLVTNCKQKVADFSFAIQYN